MIPADDSLVEEYIARIATLPHGDARSIRIALTAMHGVGGETATAALRAAGFEDLHVVAEQFDPDPTFPTVEFPNPEEPGAADRLLALARSVDADLAIALDPDATAAPSEFATVISGACCAATKPGCSWPTTY